MCVPPQIKTFYEDLGIDLDSPTILEDPTVLRHEPEQHDRFVLNFFILMGVNENEGNKQLKEFAEKYGQARIRQFSKWQPGMLNGFRNFYQKVSLGITQARRHFADPTKIAEHREALYKARWNALEQVLITPGHTKSSGVGSSTVNFLQVHAKRMGFNPIDAKCAIDELKAKYPRNFPKLPVIQSPLTAKGIVGKLFSYTIVASGSPTFYTASGLPRGLSVDQSSGVVSGYPRSAGTLNVRIAAKNVSGTGDAILKVKIKPSRPSASSTTTPRKPYPGTKRSTAAKRYAVTKNNVNWIKLFLWIMGILTPVVAILIISWSFEKTYKVRLGVAKAPSKSMPVLYVRSPMSIEATLSRSILNYFFTDKDIENNLESLADGNSSTGWELVSSSKSNPFVCNFSTSTKLEGIVVFSNSMEKHEQQLMGIVLRFDDSTEKIIWITKKGGWQTFLFNGVNTKRLEISASEPEAIGDLSLMINELWFLEEYRVDSDPWKWEGHWVGEGVELQLIKMSDSWFGGTYFYDGMKQSVLLRVMPFEMKGDVILEGTIFSSNHFNANIEVKIAVIQKMIDGINLIIKSRSDGVELKEIFLQKKK